MPKSEWIRFCPQCHRSFAFDDRAWRCICGDVLALPQRSAYTPAVRKAGFWRHATNLPLGRSAAHVTLGEGDTPLIRLPSLGGNVYAKLEFLAPTGSFKDRGAATAVSRFASIGITSIVDDSAGNGGVSLAAYCAAAGIRCDIHALASSSPVRLRQVQAYGARYIPVQGSRAAATEAAVAASEQSYYAGHAWDPFFIEGIKTIAYELAEQLVGDPPARVIFPLGQGTLLLGLLRGFRELVGAGRLLRQPRLIAVQTDACAPLHTMVQDGLNRLPLVSRPARIMADGIAVAAPVRWRELVDDARGGAISIVAAPDGAIPAALQRLGACGLYVEPTSAVVLTEYERSLENGEPAGATVLILTSSGLKANVTAAAAH